jgi:hypothetical protein
MANGANRVNIINNSNAPGLLVSGTHQQVGNIDGSGTTQVSAGSNLTADHIIQSALVIGGTSKNPGLVTIDAGDAAGNSLAIPALVAGLTASGAPIAAGIGLPSPTAYSLDGGLESASAAPLISNTAGGPTSVPEPSSVLLLAVGSLALGAAAIRRQLRSLNCKNRDPRRAIDQG